MNTNVNNMTYGIADTHKVTAITSDVSKVPTTDWSIRHAGLDKLTFKGKDQRVGILDTGTDIHATDLEGQVTAANFIRGNQEVPAWRDTAGHGCIQPNAHIMTSLLGMSTIKEFYDVLPIIPVVGSEGYATKSISKDLINTTSWDKKFHRSKVTAAHKLPYSGDVYRVKFRHGELLLTPWHPLYVQTSSRGTEKTIKKVRADQLTTKKHKLVVNSVELQSPVDKYHTVTYNHSYSSGVCAVTRDLTIDSEIAWLLGFIITDGHVCNQPNKRGGYTRCMSLSQCDKSKILLDIAADIIQRRLGYNPRYYRYSNGQQATSLATVGRGLVELLISLGIPSGKKSKTITVPTVIKSSPLDVVMAFLGGCIDGDGCVAAVSDSKAGSIRVVTSSKLFASELSLLLRSVGMCAGVVFNAGSTKSTFGSCDMYHVCINQYDSRLCNYVHHPERRARLNIDRKARTRCTERILSITKEQYVGDLYDLTVDSAHNYIAEGVLVSNTFCVGEIVGKGIGITGVAPQATAFSGRILYGNEKDSTRNNMEQDIADGVLACVKDGCGVISMSIGGPGATSVMRDALQHAVDAGIIPVAASGNERLDGSPYASYPASYPMVISVASANKDDMPAWFSTMGTVQNPGKPEISVASLDYYWGVAPGLSNYTRMIGTSMATPTIAGVALLWREAMQKIADAGGRPFPTGANVLAEFRQWLYRVAKDTNANGWDPELGYGVLLLSPSDMPSA